MCVCVCVCVCVCARARARACVRVFACVFCDYVLIFGCLGWISSDQVFDPVELERQHSLHDFDAAEAILFEIALSVVWLFC